MKPTRRTAKNWANFFVFGMIATIMFAGQSLAADKNKTEFAFEVPKPNTEFKTTDIITISGSHRLKTKEHVWIFLVDSFGGYYIQNPAVELLEDGKWEATNIRPSKGIRAIVAVQVNTKGDDQVRKWVESSRWGKISPSEVTTLPGYKKLGRVSIITPKPE